MFGIKIQGTFISLSPDTSLTIEMNHPMGTIIDGLDHIQGDYSFPIDIPMDDINVGIIGRIDRLDVDSILLQDEYCELWIDGVLFYTGKAHVKAAGRYRAELFMTFNEFKSLEDVNLAALDYEGVRAIGSDTASREAHALDTANNPLDHDYVFAPVFNPVFDVNSLTQLFEEALYQNYWLFSAGKFPEDGEGIPTPFIRIDYLLSRIIHELGYTLDNQWQITDELKLLLLYNNYSINTQGNTWTEDIDLANHVPYRRAIDFLTSVIGTFALGIFPDHRTKTISLIPFRDLIQAGVAEDWTSKAAADFKYNTDREFISKFRHDIDENDELSVDWSGVVVDKNDVFGEGLTARDDTAPTFLNIRYAIADNTYYLKVASPLQYVMAGQDHKPVVKTGSDKEYISALIPLWNSWNITKLGDTDDDLEYQEWMVPMIKHKGYNTYMTTAKTTCMSFRVMFYRGFQPCDISLPDTYPMAGTTAYNIRGDQVGDYSLHWDGEFGLYEQWWKLAYEMLRDKKTVTRQLLLNIRDLMNFRFQNKYRIENQNYFMTRLRFTLRTQGISPVEATMFTTL